MVDEILEELRDAIQKAQTALKQNLGKLRTGRAHAGMLDSIKVDYYGAMTPIAQMATVNVPEARLLTVKAWDKSATKALEKALRESDLGLNPQPDGELIRIPVPPLSEERRKDLVKIARRTGEDCKVAIRHARHEALGMFSEMKTGGDISEDDADRAKKQVEEIVSQAGQSTDVIVQAKEKEILTV